MAKFTRTKHKANLYDNKNRKNATELDDDEPRGRLLLLYRMQGASGSARVTQHNKLFDEYLGC